MSVQSLPDAVVARLFTALRASYGAAFDRQWECPPDENPEEFGAAMKAHWARELGGYARNLRPIAYALENLPEYPPTLPQFRALCRRAPGITAPALESPKCAPDPAVMAKVTQAVKARSAHDSKGWAWDLAKRELWQQQHPRDVGGKDRLTLVQRTSWRQALGLAEAITAAEALAEEVAA